MQFRVTHVQHEAPHHGMVPSMEIDSVSDSSEPNPPLTDDVHERVPVLPDVKPGDVVKCAVAQTYLPNDDLTYGPRSQVGTCS